MTQRFLPFATALLFVAGLIAGCVDIPSTGQTPPDLRSQVRFINAGRGTDTVSLLVYSFRATLAPETTSVPGATLITSREIVHTTVRRVLVDFTQAFQVLVDGASKGSIGFGQATAYLDLPSGGREIKLVGTGTLVDSLAIKDTTYIVDTVRGSATTRGITEAKHNTFTSLAGTTTEVLDSTDVAVIMPTETKATVFLMTDTVGTVNERDGLLEFGKTRYVYNTERYTFAAPGIPDSTLVRFANASSTVTSLRVVLGTSVQVSSLSFLRQSSYLHYHAGTYTFYLRNAATSALVDSLTISGASNKRYTAILLDSLSSVVIRTYQDE